MKNYLSLIIALIFITIGANGQKDTSLAKITFQTKDNMPVIIYEKKYLGDISLSGYNFDGYTYQKGQLTKKEFLLSAPGNISFKKDSLYELVMKSKYCSGMEFTIDTKINNQVWMLTPAGNKFNKSRKQMYIGIIGAVISTVTFGLIAALNKHKNDVYEMELEYYNKAKEVGGGFFTDLPPEEPKNLELRYIIPTITMGISISLAVNGKRLHKKNRPMTIRIE